MREEADIRRTTLDNGLRIVTELLPHARSLTTGIWVGVGSRDEPAEHAGASHFLEHLLFKGTADRSAFDLAVDIDAVGGEMNAYTAKEHTAFYTRVPAAAAALGIDALVDVVAAPAFDEEDVEAERRVILEELLMEEDTPDDLVHTGLFESLFVDHPLGWEVLGNVDTISAMTHTDIRAFFDAWYTPANLVVAAAGQIDHEHLVEAVTARFADAPTGARPQREAPTEPIRDECMVPRSTEQAHLSIGWLGPSQNDDDRHAIAIGNQILGGGLSSRLFQEIRERRGLSYSVYSAMTSYSDAGAISVYAGTAPSHLAETREVLDQVIDDICTTGVTDKELATALGFVEGSLLLGLEDSGSRMARLATSETVRGFVPPLDDYLEKLRAVTVSDINRVLKEVFSGPRCTSIVGPMEAS